MDPVTAAAPVSLVAGLDIGQRVDPSAIALAEADGDPTAFTVRYLERLPLGTPYPAVLLTHGMNDPRVDVWQSLKTTARLQQATSSGRPILLRLERQAGHGVGSTRAQRLAEYADIHSFLLWQLRDGK